MAIDHFVPECKELFIKVGGYLFVGPCQAKLAKGVLPETYTDGTPTVQTFAPQVESFEQAEISLVDENGNIENTDQGPGTPS